MTEKYTTVTVNHYGYFALESLGMAHFKEGFTCDKATCAWCNRPKYVPTRRDKMRYKIQNIEYRIGLRFLNIANKLGAYNESDY